MVTWRSYNESLVRRGEVMLDFDTIDRWQDEMERMIDGKMGCAVPLSDSFVHLLGYMRAYFHLSYRQIEGVALAY